jgi:hypothetical protein
VGVGGVGRRVRALRAEGGKPGIASCPVTQGGAG